MLVVIIAIFFGDYMSQQQQKHQAQEQIAPNPETAITQTRKPDNQTTLDLLNQLEVKGRAPKTNYSRDQFGGGWWNKINNCDTRNLILKRDLKNVQLADDHCTVLSGILDDPYTAKQITFWRGVGTSNDVQIDHVVALSDAWQKGAQALSFNLREEFNNDSLNLLAVEGAANQAKSGSDAATWLPANKAFRCQYVSRQVKVKYKYLLWITSAEKTAIEKNLTDCN